MRVLTVFFQEAYGLFNQERELMRKLKLIGDKNFLEDKSDEAKKLYGELKVVFSCNWAPTAPNYQRSYILSILTSLNAKR